MSRDCENCDVFGCASRRDNTPFIGWTRCEEQRDYCEGSITRNYKRPPPKEGCSCWVCIMERQRLEGIQKCVDKMEAETAVQISVKQWKITYKWRHMNSPPRTWYDKVAIKDAVYPEDAVIKVRAMHYETNIIDCEVLTEKEVPV